MHFPFAFCKAAIFSAFLAVLLSSFPALAAANSDHEKYSLAGLPNWLESEIQKAGSYGVLPFVNYWGIFQGNPVGGQTQAVAYSQEMLFGVTLDMEKLVGWRGASFRISGSENTGTNLSQSIPNTFNVSQSYVTPTVLLYQLYYAQKLLDDRVEFRLGRMTSSDWFASMPAFGMQVQGGIDGNPTSLFLNSKFTSSPNATWGAAAKVRPTEETIAKAGVFQATSQTGVVANHGLNFSFRGQDGVLAFGEFDWEPAFGKRAAEVSGKGAGKNVVAASPGLPGIYKVGGYFSNYAYEGFMGGYQQYTYGMYWMAQQMVWRSEKNPDINFSVWGGATYSPQYQVAQMPVMGFGGTIFQGLLPGRTQDQFLCTWMTGGFSSSYADAQELAGQPRPTAETALDFSYVINLTPNVFVQPDIQYIIQPNGVGTTQNALVLGVQVGCNF